jgi:hypothetical protein
MEVAPNLGREHTTPAGSCAWLHPSVAWVSDAGFPGLEAEANPSRKLQFGSRRMFALGVSSSVRPRLLGSASYL